jgi:nucleoside 2-deoxyribosyltransferase
MKIYLITPVRMAGPKIAEMAAHHTASLEAMGHKVHFPPRDAPQDCKTGRSICEAHLKAMRACDSVHVLWDVDSKGSHFDLGMAYALNKPIVPVACVHPEGAGKSYWKAVIIPEDIARRFY